MAIKCGRRDFLFNLLANKKIKYRRKRVRIV